MHNHDPGDPVHQDPRLILEGPAGSGEEDGVDAAGGAAHVLGEAGQLAEQSKGVRQREGRKSCLCGGSSFSCSQYSGFTRYTRFTSFERFNLFFFTQPKVTLSQHTLDHVYHYHHYLLSLGSLVHWFSY